MAQKRPMRNSAEPDRIEDPVLGTLRFTAALDGLDEYQAKVKLEGRPVLIDLYTDDAGRLAPCVLRARRIVEGFPALQTKMHRYIERNVFRNYNETWRPDKKPLTLEQVIGRLRLEVITTHPHPEATFWFSAGDLFLGHALQLRMGERNEFVGHDTPG